MSFRSSRASKKQPPPREPLKPKKKTLADACQDLLSRSSAPTARKQVPYETRKPDPIDPELMACTYGPNWREVLRSEMAEEDAKIEAALGRDPFAESNSDEDEGENVIPIPRSSEVRLKRQAS
jgi:hypothetical protein